MSARLEGDGPRLEIRALDDLARVLNVQPDRLREVALSAHSHYRTKWIPKEGGRRRLDCPQEPLKGLQSRIEKQLLSPLVVSAIAFGGVPGRSHLQAAELHARKAFVGTVDIRDFFPSITKGHVHSLLIGRGCAPVVAEVLARILTRQEGQRSRLPQGSPASTAVGNLLLQRLDSQLVLSASRRDLQVTRVLDDFTISGSSEREVKRVMDECIAGIHRLGLRVSRGKTGLRQRAVAQRVNHLNVNDRVSVPRTADAGTTITRKSVRDTVRRLRRYGTTESERRSIEGKIAYIGQFNCRLAERLRAELAEAPLRE